MPKYAFWDEILIPYLRETSHNRKRRTQQREAEISRRLDFFRDRVVSYDETVSRRINGPLIIDYRKMRAEAGVKAETVRRELALASRACSYAVSEWDFLMPNPFKGRLLPASYRPDPTEWTVLSPIDEKRLLLAATPLTRDIIRFALVTGFRQSEILGLTWDRIEGDLVRFTPQTQKANRVGRRVLPDSAIEILARQPVVGLFVFHNGDGRQINRYRFHHGMWDRARRAAGVEVKFHELRKTAGQRWLEATGDMVVVQHQLGHASLRTTERVYVREPLDRMRQALKSL